MRGRRFYHVVVSELHLDQALASNKHYGRVVAVASGPAQRYSAFLFSSPNHSESEESALLRERSKDGFTSDGELEG